MSDDPLARLRAEMDQAREGLKEVAANLHAFFEESVEQGFSEEQAFRLTRDFLAQMSRAAGGDGE
jgi:hypothetical protein